MKLPEDLTRRECEVLAALYPSDSVFRSRIVMSRHGFGRGELADEVFGLDDGVGGDVQLAEHLEELHALRARRLLRLSRGGGHMGGVGGWGQAEARSCSSQKWQARISPESGLPWIRRFPRRTNLKCLTALVT